MLNNPTKFSTDFNTLYQLSSAVQGRIASNFDEEKGPEAEAMGIFLNTLSTLFCEGETFFVDAIRHYREKIRKADPTFINSPLDKDIGKFIGHEAHHTSAHKEYNYVLYSKGYINVTRPLRKALNLVRKSPIISLHATTVLEHYTATMARLILDHTDVRELLGTQELALWEYHALDEWNHRTISYDVLTLVDKHRSIAFIPVTLLFILVTLYLYIKNGGRWNTFLARKLIELTPTILEYFNSDYTP